MSQADLLDLPHAAYIEAMNNLGVQQLIDVGIIGRDLIGDPTPIYTSGWIFRSATAESAPYVEVEGTGKVAVVLDSRVEWSPANPHNTATFPSLSVVIYADSSRDVTKGIVAHDAEQKCRQVYAALDAVYHRPQNDTVLWGGIRVISSIRRQGLQISDVLNKRGLVRGLAMYSVIMA